MSETLSNRERRERGRARRLAGCGGVKCPCLCHDTGGGVHDHHGRVCDGAPDVDYVDDTAKR